MRLRPLTLAGAGIFAGALAVTPPPVLSATAPMATIQAEIERVLDEVEPSVVTVISRRYPPGPPGDPGSGQAPGRVHVGSGVVYDDLGHVVTTASVADVDDEIAVETQSGQRFPAHLVTRDPTANVSLLDIGTRGLKSLPQGTSALAVGSWVVLVGYSAGSRIPASALGTICQPFAVSGLREGESVLTVDAAVRRGWSGGAVVNTAGELIGLVAGRLDPHEFLTQGADAATVRGPEGERAAPGATVVVPVEQIRDVVSQIVVSGARKDHGFLGVRIVGLTPYLRTVLGAEKSARGVVVAEVIGGGPAERSGVRSGDVIVSLGGSGVASVAELTQRVANARPGTRLDVEVLREGNTVHLAAEIGFMPDALRRAEALRDSQKQQTDRRKFLRSEIQRLEDQIEHYRSELSGAGNP